MSEKPREQSDQEFSDYDSQEIGEPLAVENRAEYLKSVEVALMESINKRSPLLDKPKISALKDGEKEIATVEQKRAFEKPDNGPQDLWLIVDFDDVMNRTTEFNHDLQQSLSEKTGIPLSQIEKFYEQAKEENENKKKVFRFSKFIELIKKASKKPKAVDGVIKGIDHSKYADQAVKRALIASRFGWDMGYSYSLPATVRVSILTHGDLEYQRSRVEKSGVAEVADEVIYTEASKRKVVEALAQRDYPQGDAPFIITFDDSPEQVKDLARLKGSQKYVNVRFHHPQAKRYNAPHSKAGKVVKAEEDSPSQAAFDMFTIALLATAPEAKQIMSPFSVYDYEKNRKDREKILSSWGYDLHEWHGEDLPKDEEGMACVGTEDVGLLEEFIKAEK